MSFSKLFAPLTVGPYRLSHRVIMAPLTRMRAQDGTVAAHALNVLHYKQRASDGGLIIAEASQVSQAGCKDTRQRREFTPNGKLKDGAMLRTLFI